ncbi:MAG: AAA family ATPase [Myxococcales bacterium]|nr:AAA family ATPase [Myxococcales bacterium]MDD9971217.1 AAA family ATPase [Myxococcales bacterium]
MTRFDDIHGQPVAVRTLERALTQDRLASAYLFAGPSGVGKEALAMALACARNCPNGGCKCPICERIRSGQHPDVRVFHPREEGNRNLQVEVVREEIRPLSQFAPFEAKTAFLIFPDADVSFPVQHAEAANAMLKTLEEPRPNLVFILIAARPERLLQTIRSRCQQVRFGPLPALTVQDILERHGVEPGVREAAVALAGGRADRALDLAREGRGEAMLNWALRLDQAMSGGGVAERLDLGEELARSEDRSLILDTLCLYYRDVAAAGLAESDPLDTLRFRHRADAIVRRARELGPGEAATRVERVERLNEQLARNANPEIALDALLFAFG